MSREHGEAGAGVFSITSVHASTSLRLHHLLPRSGRSTPQARRRSVFAGAAVNRNVGNRHARVNQRHITGIYLRLGVF